MHSRLTPVTLARAALVLFPFLPVLSCTQPSKSPQTAGEDTVVASQSVNTQEILSRCADAHSQGRTFHIIGVLRDNRAGKKNVVPIVWDYVRPNRCRLQIEMSVAVVLGENCWTYTPERGRFISHRRFTRTPIQTASFLLSDGIAMLLPELWAGNSLDQGAAWTLEGIGWSSGRPCYVMGQDQVEADRPRRLLLWIDQADFLLRKWVIMLEDSNGNERPAVECDFNQIDVNVPVRDETFRLEPPDPITISQKQIAQPESP
jgi:outer membrane lipoprotein-sorting protein